MFKPNNKSGEKDFLKFRQCIFAISLLSPFGKRRTPHLYKLETLSPRDALWQVWLASPFLTMKYHLITCTNHNVEFNTNNLRIITVQSCNHCPEFKYK